MGLTPLEKHDTRLVERPANELFDTHRFVRGTLGQDPRTGW